MGLPSSAGFRVSGFGFEKCLRDVEAFWRGSMYRFMFMHSLPINMKSMRIHCQQGRLIVATFVSSTTSTSEFIAIA